MFTQSPGEVFATLAALEAQFAETPAATLAPPAVEPKPGQSERAVPPDQPPVSSPPEPPVPPISEPKPEQKPSFPPPQLQSPPSTLPVQQVRGAKDAWKVLVTNDTSAASDCKSLGLTSNSYDASKGRIGEAKEEAAKAEATFW